MATSTVDAPGVEGGEDAMRAEENRRFGPVAPPPVGVVTVSEGEAFVVPITVERGEGERIARQAIQEGLLRPPDSHKADIESVLLVWVPLWRIDAAIEGFHLGVRPLTDGAGKLRAVLPTGGPRRREAVSVVLARRLLPFDPAPKIEIELRDMVPRRDHAITEGEVILPDVSRADAEQEAGARLRGSVIPGNALYAKYEARVKSAALCHYPLWLRRYRYEGDATAAGRVEECHVAVSARTGRVVSARHPSALRSLGQRVRRLFK